MGLRNDAARPQAERIGPVGFAGVVGKARGQLAAGGQVLCDGFAADPTNAQLLWDRAEYLRQQGQIAKSRELLTQLKDGDWQPRFNGLKAQARQAVEGR